MNLAGINIKMSDSGKSFGEAADDCLGNGGGYLASISTHKELMALKFLSGELSKSTIKNKISERR